MKNYTINSILWMIEQMLDHHPDIDEQMEIIASINDYTGVKKREIKKIKKTIEKIKKIKG
jgi:hypothetical protein